MQRRVWLIVGFLAAVLVYGSLPLNQTEPIASVQQPTTVSPECTARLQLSVLPDFNTAESSADGKVLLISAEDKLTLIKNDGGNLTETLIATGGVITDSALSLDGNWLVTSDNQSLQMRSTADGALLYTVQLPEKNMSVDLEISADGTTIACLCNSRLEVYFGPNLGLRWSAELPASEAERTLLMSANGLTLAVYGPNDLVVFAPDGASPLWQSSLSGECQMAAISPDGVYLALETMQPNGSGRVELFERWNSSPTWEYGHPNLASNLRFSQSSNWLAVATDQFYLFNCEVAQPVAHLRQSGAIALSDERVMIIAGRSLYRFSPAEQDVVSWQLPLELAGDLRYVYSASEWLFAVSQGGQVYLVNLPAEI